MALSRRTRGIFWRVAAQNICHPLSKNGKLGAVQETHIILRAGCSVAGLVQLGKMLRPDFYSNLRDIFCGERTAAAAIVEGQRGGHHCVGKIRLLGAKQRQYSPVQIVNPRPKYTDCRIAVAGQVRCGRACSTAWPVDSPARGAQEHSVGGFQHQQLPAQCPVRRSYNARTRRTAVHCSGHPKPPAGHRGARHHRNPETQ